MTIKALSLDDRPREKLLNSGQLHLSDAELLAILLGSGSRHENSLQLAQRMLSENHGDINKVAKLSINELKKYKGIGKVKAINISAAFELGRRRLNTSAHPTAQIKCSAQAFEVFNAKLSDLPHEEFWVLFLNRANRVICLKHLSKGGATGTIMDARIVMKLALEYRATGLMLAHNHPSGNLQPSEQDKIITANIKKAAALFDIRILDHLIIGDGNYFSFADNGWI